MSGFLWWQVQDVTISHYPLKPQRKRQEHTRTWTHSVWGDLSGIRSYFETCLNGTRSRSTKQTTAHNQTDFPGTGGNFSLVSNIFDFKRDTVPWGRSDWCKLLHLFSAAFSAFFHPYSFWNCRHLNMWGCVKLKLKTLIRSRSGVVGDHLRMFHLSSRRLPQF